ncbi:MAG: hypothetical protein IBX69_09460 [Anaerolineales bacterium]|nr:hypothetical protein [Anaerolineales bacterium]
MEIKTARAFQNIEVCHNRCIFQIPLEVFSIDQGEKIFEEPKPIAEISDKLLGEVKGSNNLVPFEAAGTHVEYLYQCGVLLNANL